MLERRPRGHGFRESRPERPFQRGDIKYIILQLLKDGPSHGYEIIRALEERFRGFYSPSPGTIYPTLQMLEKIGDVTVVEQDGKKVYTITDKGGEFLDEHGEVEERLKDQIKDWWNPEKIDDRGETMREFRRLAELLRVKVRTVDTKELGRIRQVITHAYEEVLKD